MQASEAEIYSMLAGERLSGGALVWRDGLPSWQPIVAHFRIADANAPELRRRPSGSGGFWALFFGYALCFAGFAAIHWFGDRMRMSGVIQSFSLSPFMVLVAATTIVFAVSAICLIALWRFPVRRIGPGVRGIVLSICLVGFFLEFVSVASSLYRLRTLAAVESAAKDYANYTLSGDKVTRTVSLIGTIGEGIARALGEYDQRYGGLARLEIESHGGLVDEALAVGEFLQSRRDVVVIVRNTCDSACILIAVASENTYADQGMSFGFHSVYNILDTDDEMLRFGTILMQDESKQFLAAHHVPADILDRASRLPAEEVLAVPAADLVAAGAIKGLVVGDKVVLERRGTLVE